MRVIKIIFIYVLMISLLLTVSCGNSANHYLNNETTSGINSTTTKLPIENIEFPWEADGAKQPLEYTWEEYIVLTPIQQVAFQSTFASMEEFDSWMQEAQLMEEINPWEQDGAKQPNEYTWREFEALSGKQQIAFQNAFGSVEEFEKWMNNVQNEIKKHPWDEAGAKPQSEYTWTEFEVLSPELQIAFQNTIDDFETWFKENYPG